ncbi:MAG: hypothetical protein JSU96_08915 [Acidobacteriota bacterium]|nr:MAG: hypothetical protein JSU96_08915 [Acidobacteriota bacterium]
MSRLSFIKVSLVVLMVVLAAPALMAEGHTEQKAVFAAAPQGGGAEFTLYAAAIAESEASPAAFFRQAGTTNITATWQSSTTTDDLEIVREMVVAAGEIGSITFPIPAAPAWRDAHELRTGVVTVTASGDVAASLSALVLIPTATESALGGRPSAEGTNFTLNALESEKFGTGVAIARLTDETATWADAAVCTFTSGDMVGELSIVPPDRQVQAFISEIMAPAPAPADAHGGAMNVQISCNQAVGITALLQNKTTGIIATTPVVAND